MNKLFPYTIYFVLICCVLGLWYHNTLLKRDLAHNVIDTVITNADTVFLHDTVRFPYPKLKTVKIIDTIYIPSKGDSLGLPVERKMYTDDDTYKAWLSGICVTLDSIHISRKVEIRNFNHVVYRDVEKREWNTYLFVGGNQFKEYFSPSIGLSFKSPKNWLFSIETGYYDNNMWGGLKIGYKIR